jgi:hypothetical protein
MIPKSALEKYLGMLVLYMCVVAYLGRCLRLIHIRLVIHVQDPFFDTNSMVVPVLESD